MKPAPFDYVAPGSVAETLDVLAEAGGGATLLAGGQTLMPLLALRMSQPFILVDVNKIEGIRGVSHTAETTRIAAGTRQAVALADAELKGAQPVFNLALSHVGHHQTRNRGTIGGSVSLGEPAAEMPATAVALGAEVEIHSRDRGVRRVKAEEFYLGPYMTVLEPDELVTAIHYPRWGSDAITVFREVAQRPGDFALVGLVGRVRVAQGKIAEAGLAWFGMGPTPIKARQAEAALIGASVSDIDTRAIAELAVADTDPFTDHHATAHYRRTVGRRIFGRTLGEALNIQQAAA
ncbi:FAD binding domain-containing protein [Novosphingobium sp. PS1R-30]|uniref:FAD binding domain-containing protein n=1 Tax=Novosphingobium anseongense TaxID=3133436 RepID=A0ABU8RYN1_9SPHN